MEIRQESKSQRTFTHVCYIFFTQR